MDPYIVEQLFSTRRADLVREADESRTARCARDHHEEPRAPKEPATGDGRARRLRIA